MMEVVSNVNVGDVGVSRKLQDAPKVCKVYVRKTKKKKNGDFAGKGVIMSLYSIYMRRKHLLGVVTLENSIRGE